MLSPVLRLLAAVQAAAWTNQLSAAQHELSAKDELSIPVRNPNPAPDPIPDPVSRPGVGGGAASAGGDDLRQSAQLSAEPPLVGGGGAQHSVRAARPAAQPALLPAELLSLVRLAEQVQEILRLTDLPETPLGNPQGGKGVRVEVSAVSGGGRTASDRQQEIWNLLLDILLLLPVQVQGKVS